MSLTIPFYKKKGIQEPFIFPITEEGRVITAFPYKWFQVTVTNDDENNDLYVIFDDQPRIKPTILHPGEDVEHNYDQPTVWRVELWTDAGKTAVARIDAMR